MNKIATIGHNEPPEPIADFPASREAADALIEQISAEARAAEVDLSTDRGRKAVASAAYKVSQHKTKLDASGKKLTEEARKQIGVIDGVRKHIRDTLDELRDEVRRPLTEWEEAERRREAEIQGRIAEIEAMKNAAGLSSSEIGERIEALNAVELPEETFGYALGTAQRVAAETLQALTDAKAAAEHREAEKAELERLRAIQREQEERERKEREAAAAREAEDRAERERLTRAAREAEERAEAAERARKQAEERAAEIERQERERAERERAAEKEAERRAKEEEEARKSAEAARKKNAARAQKEAQEAIVKQADITAQKAARVLDAIACGFIPNVRFDHD